MKLNRKSITNKNLMKTSFFFRRDFADVEIFVRFVFEKKSFFENRFTKKKRIVISFSSTNVRAKIFESIFFQILQI